MAGQFDPSAVLGQLTEGYVKLPLLQKILFPLLIAASVSGIIFVSKWANQPDYVVLFSDLEAPDSAAVVERLKDEKIKYEVRAGGSTIAISPPEVVHEMRMSLSAEGIPKGGVVGLEAFENPNLGSTTFQEKVKFMRAIQGELERTISSLDPVTAARVHIAQPDKSVFAKRGNEPTASVMLRLRSSGALDKKQIQGITRLVSGSIEGLTAENVSIVDVYGNLLTSGEGEDSETLEVEATRLAYQREVERGYVQRIEQMLSRVLGDKKAVARVTADLDFSMSEMEEETFDPGGQVIRSERSVEEGVGASQRGGIPGVVSNLSNNQELLAPPEGDSSSRREQLKNYEVSRAVSRSTSPRGKLVRLSVAVVVDGTAHPLDQGAESVEFEPLTPEMLDQIEGIVKSAVGYDPSRGDTVTVENLPFHAPQTNFAEEMDAKATQDMIFNVLFRTGPIVFLVLFFFVIVRPLVKFLVTPTEAQVDLERLLPTGIQELEQELEVERTKAAVPSYEPSIDLDQLEELMAQNSRVVKENPQQAALLIRYWLNDGRL